MHCSKCGSIIPDGFAFCAQCGTPVSQADNAEAALGQTTEPTPDAASEPAEEPESRQIKIKKKTLAIAGAAVIVVVAVAIGLFVFITTSGSYALDEKTFPDQAIRTTLAEQADADHNGSLSRDEAKAVTSLNLSGTDVASLDGLDKFENLATLDLSSTPSLKQADFSNMKSVETLNIAGSGLSSVDTSSMGSLKSLQAEGAAITNLDVSKNTNLAELQVDYPVNVTGLENTGLREQYLMTSAVDSGSMGAPDQNGVGGSVEEAEYEFYYDKNGVMASYSLTTKYYGGSSTTGRNYGADGGCIVRASGTGSEASLTGEAQYDGANGPTLVKTVRASNGTTTSNTTRMTYDSSGNLTELVYDAGSAKTTMKCTYDSAGHVTNVDTLTNSGTMSAVFSYDSSGHMVSAKNNYQEFAFEYDNAGRVATKRLWWLDKGKRVGDPVVATFEYDADGRVVKGTRTTTGSSSKTVWTGVVEYDNHGLATRIDRNVKTESGGKTNSYDGSMTLSYTRTFVSKDAPETAFPVKVGDPTAMMYTELPLVQNMFDDGTQSEIVSTTCGRVFSNSWYMRM